MTKKLVIPVVIKQGARTAFARKKFCRTLSSAELYRCALPPPNQNTNLCLEGRRCHARRKNPDSTTLISCTNLLSEWYIYNAR